MKTDYAKKSAEMVIAHNKKFEDLIKKTNYKEEIEAYYAQHKEPSPVVRAVLEDTISVLEEALATAKIELTMAELLEISSQAIIALPLEAWGTPNMVKDWLNR